MHDVLSPLLIEIIAFEACETEIYVFCLCCILIKNGKYFDTRFPTEIYNINTVPSHYVIEPLQTK